MILYIHKLRKNKKGVVIMKFQEYVEKSNLDLSLIENYVRNYGLLDVRDSSPFQGVKSLLNPWFNSKSKLLFNIFGDKLILEKEVVFKKKEKELWKEYSYNKAIQYFITCLIRDLKKEIYHKFSSIDYTRGLEKIRNTILSSPSAMLENRCSCSHSFIFPETGKTLQWTESTKTLKVLKAIAEYYNLKEEYESFRIAHSQILNARSFSGTLCLSIHPMDYFTLSDNNNGWSSCLRWQGSGRGDGGEYRAGTLEMLSSPTAIVAYLRSSSNTLEFSSPEGTRQQWNSKKWRMLCLIDENCLIANTQYPVEYDDANRITLEWIKELVENATGFQYEDSPKKIDISNCYRGYCEEEESDTEVSFSASTTLMYNELERQLVFLKKTIANGHYIVEFSGTAHCLCCGEEVNSADSLLCECCSSTRKCDACEERYLLDELTVTREGYRYCEDCYAENIHNCRMCKTSVHREEAKELYLAVHNKTTTNLNREELVFVCEDCFTKMYENKIIMKIKKTFPLQFQGTYNRYFIDPAVAPDTLIGEIFNLVLRDNEVFGREAC